MQLELSFGPMTQVTKRLTRCYAAAFVRHECEATGGKKMWKLER